MYQITEEELYHACNGGLQSWQEKAIRSRPAPSVPKGMTAGELWDYSNDLTEVVKIQTRNQTLDEVIKIITRLRTYQRRDPPKWIKSLHRDIESLRSTEAQQ